MNCCMNHNRDWCVVLLRVDRAAKARTPSNRKRWSGNRRKWRIASLFKFLTNRLAQDVSDTIYSQNATSMRHNAIVFWYQTPKCSYVACIPVPCHHPSHSKAHSIQATWPCPARVHTFSKRTFSVQLVYDFVYIVFLLTFQSRSTNSLPQRRRRLRYAKRNRSKHTYTHAHTYTHQHICTQKSGGKHTHKRTPTLANIPTQAYTYAHTHTCKHIHTYTHIQIHTIHTKRSDWWAVFFVFSEHPGADEARQGADGRVYAHTDGAAWTDSGKGNLFIHLVGATPLKFVTGFWGFCLHPGA